MLEGIVLARTGAVPLRRQIAAVLAAAIRDGVCPAATPLPGTRELADALRVHRHTVAAAYAQLRGAGLVRIESGRRVRVMRPERSVEARGESACVGAAGAKTGSEQAAGGLDRTGADSKVLRVYVTSSRERGRSARQVAAELERARRALLARRLLIVEPEAALRRLLVHEVDRAVRRPVEGSSLRGVRRDPDRARGRLVLARPVLHARLRPALAGPAEPFPLRCGGGTAELRRVRALAPGSVVTVLTRSPTVRRYARELLATAAGVGVACPPPGDRPGVERALRVARLVLADAWCARQPWLRGCRRAVEVRVLHRRSVRALRRWLGSSPEEEGA